MVGEEYEIMCRTIVNDFSVSSNLILLHSSMDGQIVLYDCRMK